MKKFVLGMAFLTGLFSFIACNEIEIQSPPGPDGKSAYQVWVDAVERDIIAWDLGTDLANYFKYLKGEPGESAYETWKAYIASDTVSNPHNPGEIWPKGDNSEADFFRFLTGADGDSPTINADGNWEIGGEDTGVRAQADSVYIGDDGYWYINGDSTSVRATGDSAYEIWVKEVEVDNITDVTGATWPEANITLQDFWNYLQGKLPDGTKPIVVYEKTLLEFNSSEKTDSSMIFTFTTDSGAVVTMNYQEKTVTATADDQGNCVIEFPRYDSKTITAVVTATAPDKNPSDPISVRIPEAPVDYVMDVLFDQPEWYSDQTQVTPSQDYGYFDDDVIFEGDTIPYLKLNHYAPTTAELPYVKIPFTTSANITKVTIAQVSGAGQFYVSVEPVATGDYSSGYVVIKQIATYNQEGEDTYITVTGWSDTYIPIAMISLCGSSYNQVYP